MFKNLRDRLRSVSKEMEKSMEFTPKDDLDAQLAAELEAQLEAELAEATQPKSEPAAHPQLSPVGNEPVPESKEPLPMEAKLAETTPEPITPVEAAPAAPVPGPVSAPVVAPAPVAPTPQPAPAVPQAKPIHTPKPPVPGRKILSAEELQAKLDKELESSVEMQKSVESSVKESGSIGRFTINEDVLEDLLWELEIGLLESDVALPVIEAIKKDVKEQLLSMTMAGRSAEQVVEKVLRGAINRVLSVQTLDFDAFVDRKIAAGKSPVVIMFVGVNGTGKTTSIGRIAYRLQKRGVSTVMAAGDTFRAGAIEQLQVHGDRLGIKVVRHNAGADPAAVAYDAIEHAKARNKQVVLLDTAGRMQNNTNLMAEMDKIRRIANPDLVVFVGDSLAGNDAVEQATQFDRIVDINAVILTKVDVDAKGGAALSVAYTINKPMIFIGVGQEYPDLLPFDAKYMVDRLFGDDS